MVAEAPIEPTVAEAMVGGGIREVTLIVEREWGRPTLGPDPNLIPETWGIGINGRRGGVYVRILV